MFSLICVWINGWVNNREAGDLRRHRGHYDVSEMIFGTHRPEVLHSPNSQKWPNLLSSSFWYFHIFSYGHENSDLLFFLFHGRHVADDIFNCIFLNEDIWISLKISLKFKVRISNIPALVQITPWRRPGDRPLSEPMMVSLLTHICVTRPLWVKRILAVFCCCLHE